MVGKNFTGLLYHIDKLLIFKFLTSFVRYVKLYLDTDKY